MITPLEVIRRINELQSERHITTLTSMDTMLKLFLIKHILTKTVLVKRIISGRNNYVYRKRT